MRFKQIIENSTTAGSVATVAQPMMTQTRESVNVRGLKPVKQVMQGKAKKQGTYANSISESKVTEDDLSEQDLIVIPGQGRLKRTGFVKHDLDQGEHEGHTLKNSLHTIIRVATDLNKRLSVQSEFPEWVSEKIGATKSMMVTVMDYLISSQEMQHDTEDMSEAYGRNDRRDAYQRDYDSSVSGMGDRQSDAYRQDGGGNDERHDLDPSDWYIVKDGKMFAASIYPRQVKQAEAEGFSRTKDEARAKASSEGVAEGEIDTSRMNKQHQDFYNTNPNFKRDDREATSVGGRLATKVTPKTAQVTKKPMTPFESIDNAWDAAKKKVSEGSAPKEKQKTPYRDINGPEYKAAADKQKEKMDKDKAAEPGKKLADKIVTKKK